MTESTESTETSAPEATVSAHVKSACDIASGKVRAANDDEGFNIIGAKKDLNSRGNGPEWYRMVLRNGQWHYVSDERLPSGSFRASDRRATVRGAVFHGEITITHDRGKAVDKLGNLECRGPDGEYFNDESTTVKISSTRDGQLKLTLPDGSVVMASNPRRR